MENIEVFGNAPQACFGHTVTFISKGKAILFGGATGDTGKYSITNESFSYEVSTRIWKKIEASGQAPSARAAHASSSVETNQMVVYGGAIGGGSFASDDLFLLDLRSNDDTGIWTIVSIVGPTPGRRYGHTLTFARPYLILFGGNTGQEPVNDVWVLNVEKSPFQWQKLEFQCDQPPSRVYHTTSLCSLGAANGMVVIYGGRRKDGNALNDTWGLRRHRSGNWDWVKAPYKSNREPPVPRYQHSSLFFSSAMAIIGGRTNNIGETAGIEIYDTETSEWYKFNTVQRFRHASWNFEHYIYIFAGFEHDSPNIPTDSLIRLNLGKMFLNNEILANKLKLIPLGAPQTPPKMNTSGASTPQMNLSPTLSPNLSKRDLPANANPNQNRIETSNIGNNGDPTRITIAKKKGEKLFKINEAVVVEENKKNQDVKFKKIQVDDNATAPMRKAFKILSNPDEIHNRFISVLLQPKSFYNLPELTQFYFSQKEILELCDRCERVLMEQPMVLRVQAPIKVFGDIHGQYSDLMRFFDLWGCPHDGIDGDIEQFDYLFLGDFVDRGNHSLETICLLMSLKVRYPEQMHLIRGNHEDKHINAGFGFAEECSNRLLEGDNNLVFDRINRLFEYLPLAAVIEDKIICLHGGIGSSLNYVEQIEALPRPLEVIHEVTKEDEQLIVDILWSDPTDNDTELGIIPNCIRDPAGTGNIVKFGPDRVQSFLNNNNLSLIIRAHECVMDGFERFAGGALITLFSATDYCGKHKNAGAVLIIRKNLEIIPKLIYPANVSGNNWIEDEESLKKRPPTPPRWKKSMPRRVSYD